jgi:uncharacterized protein
MKKLNLASGSMGSFLIICILFMNQCSVDEVSVYRKIRDHADQIKVINSHEHQRPTESYGNHKFRFYHLIDASYLGADLTSAGVGVNDCDWNQLDSLSLDNLWGIYGEALNYSRGTSYYSQFVKGFQKLYGFRDLYFTKDNIKELSPKIEENYKNYGLWFKEAFHKAGYELMFLDQYWNAGNTELDNNYFALVFNINGLIHGWRGKTDKSLDEYLEYCDRQFKKFIKKKAVCLKNSDAYGRTLYYEDVPYEEARSFFDKPSSRLTPAQEKKIQDFMFNWIIQKAIEYDLPIQIHTGYLAGNGGVLDNGQPIKLNNLFLKYPKAKFVLFHGGFPWTGEYVALGKMFPNVYLDLVWLPQISRESAVKTLDEMFDCVPYNKIFWGGDCTLIEESTGALEFGKDVVAEVLAKRVKRGLLTEDLAFEIVNRIFRENEIEVFKLEKILGRDF